MRADVKAELQQNRELVWWLLFDEQCYFCQGLLCLPPYHPNQVVPEVTWGHRRHNKFPEDITLHHEDENRENNARDNIKLCHESCHRRYHAAKRAATRKEILTRVEREAEAG